MQYIEHEDGTIIDGQRAADIRRHARSIWVQLTANSAPFVSWCDADCTSLKLYYLEMRSRFTELQYCDLDWKTDMIAMDNYPNWRSSWLKRQSKLDSADNPSDDPALKRQSDLDNIGNSTSKRPRMTIGEAPARSPSIPPAVHDVMSLGPALSINIVPATPHKHSQLPVSHSTSRRRD